MHLLYRVEHLHCHARYLLVPLFAWLELADVVFEGLVKVLHDQESPRLVCVVDDVLWSHSNQADGAALIFHEETLCEEILLLAGLKLDSNIHLPLNISV